MVKNRNNIKKKINYKKRVLRGGEIKITAVIDNKGIHGITDSGFFVDKKKELTEEVCNEWFKKLVAHPNYNTHAFNEDDSIKGTSNGLENIAICDEKLREKPDSQLKKLPVESFGDGASNDGYVFVDKEQPEMPPKCEELERELSGIYQLLVNAITDKNKGYDTTSVITKVEEVFDLCAKRLVKTIETSSMNVISTICQEISALCQKLIFKKLNIALQSQLLHTGVNQKRGFFIGIEKHYPLGFFTPSFLDIDCHSLKLFDDFLNSLISGINEKNILIQSNSSYLPTKRLFLVLLKVGDSYTSSMTKCKISLDTLSPTMSRDFLDSGLSEQTHNSLPYYFSEIEEAKVQRQQEQAPVEGGSKSRRRHRQHHKSKPACKTRCGHKHKTKTHRRGRRSRVRVSKNKKYTRKY